MNTSINILYSLTPEEIKELFSETMNDSLDEISCETKNKNGVMVRTRTLEKNDDGKQNKSINHSNR